MWNRCALPKLRESKRPVVFWKQDRCAFTIITWDCLAEETGAWQKNAKGVDSFSVPLLYTVGGSQESLGEKPRQLTGGGSMPPGDARTNTKERKKLAIFQPQRMTGFSMRPEPPRCENISKPLKQSVLDRLRWRNQKARRADHDCRCRSTAGWCGQWKFSHSTWRSWEITSCCQEKNSCRNAWSNKTRTCEMTGKRCQQTGLTKNNEAYLSSSWS